jgi:hypothetical protein
MFGSMIVATALEAVLNDTAAWTDVVGEHTYRGRVAPAGIRGPFGRFYLESSAYDAGQLAAAEHITAESMRWVVAVDVKGPSNASILPAARAQLQALAGLVYITDDGYQLTFTAQGEVPMTEYLDGDQIYQRLGTIYSVTVTHGG